MTSQSWQEAEILPIYVQQTIGTLTVSVVDLRRIEIEMVSFLSMAIKMGFLYIT